MKGTSGASLCRDIYQGHLKYQTKCLECSYKSERGEPFYDLNVQIIDCEDLIKSLRSYCASEVLDGSSAYYCETCSSKQSAHRCSVIENLPPVLTISLNRFKISKETNWTRQKVTAFSSFPLFIDFSSFVGNAAVTSSPINLDNPEQEKSLVDDLKSHAVWLENVSVSSLKLAQQLISKYGMDVSIQNLDEEMKSLIDNEILGSFEKCVQDSGRDDNIYQLSTVIMHRGTAYSGHYFAYIRDHLNEGNWDLPPSVYSNSMYMNKEKEKVESVLLRPQYVEVDGGIYVISESSALGFIMTLLDDGITTLDPLTNGRPSISKDKIMKDVKSLKGEPLSYFFHVFFQRN